MHLTLHWAYFLTRQGIISRVTFGGWAWLLICIIKDVAYSSKKSGSLLSALKLSSASHENKRTFKYCKGNPGRKNNKYFPKYMHVSWNLGYVITDVTYFCDILFIFSCKVYITIQCYLLSIPGTMWWKDLGLQTTLLEIGLVTSRNIGLNKASKKLKNIVSLIAFKGF
jgi:hypothetical protein